MFNRLTLGMRILVIILVPLFLFATTIVINLYSNTKDSLYKEKQSATKAAVDIAYGMVDKFYERFRAGELTEAQAQLGAKQTIANMKYGEGGSDYYWINDYDQIMVVHPNDKMVGADQSNYKDAKGKFIFLEMTKVATTRGEGFVDYYWYDKNDQSKLVPKLSYVKGFKPWKWVVGTGIYVNDVNEQARNEVLKVLIIVIVAFAIIILCIVFFIKSIIVKPVERIGQTLSNVSDKVASASMQLSEASQELSSSSNEQAAATQESVSAMEEMSSMITQTNEFANHSQKIAEEVQSKTQEGDQTMNQLANSMRSIQEVNNQLQSIASIINDISNKTNIINDIVFKTQLLSFNASIEAARAGQHGKGFAVVAEEVGNLANMSGSAAQEIRELLERSKKHVTEIVENTQKTVTQGQEVTDSALVIFNEIAKKINSINEQIHRIVGATKEQSLGVQQTSEAMKQLDTTTKMNTQVATQAATNANDLSQSNKEVHVIVQNLNELIFGQGKNKSDSEQIYRSSSRSGNNHQNASNNKVVSDKLMGNIINKGRQLAGSGDSSSGVSADDPDFN